MLVPKPNGITQPNAYRYGFNGMENDWEIKGEGNSYDFGARMFDPRVGRWFAPDKMASRSPGWSPYRFCFDNPLRFIDKDGNYETDGHYWTVYMIGLLIGLEPAHAEQIARWAEYPDTHINGKSATLRYTWADPSHQQETHALTGGFMGEELGKTYNEILGTPNGYDSVIGGLIHRLGDVFAHSHLSGDGKMYGNEGYTIEHNFAKEPDGSQTGLRPDLIYERPELYKTYVSVLANVMQEKLANDKSKTPDLTILYDLADYAKENKVSLIGIINYEVSKKQGKSEFSIQFARGNFMVQNKDAHFEHIKNTKKYLDSKGVKYKTNEDYLTREDGSKTYLGTTFKIIK